MDKLDQLRCIPLTLAGCSELLGMAVWNDAFETELPPELPLVGGRRGPPPGGSPGGVGGFIISEFIVCIIMALANAKTGVERSEI